MRLKELRKQNNLTQNEVAEKLHVTGQTILNWESGIFEPKINQLIQLANIFNVSVDYLIGRKTSNITIDEVCNELQKITKEDILLFIKTNLSKY